MHLDYDDMPDVYKEMDIDRDWLTVGKDADKKIEKQIETYAKNQGLLVLA